MTRLVRLRAGSYETADRRHFTYLHQPEDGGRPIWLVYRAGTFDDINLGGRDTLREARDIITRDRQEIGL